MSTRICRPTLLARSCLKSRPFFQYSRQRRSFASTPNLASEAPPTTLNASRVLPYPAISIFNIIADIPSYPSFLPFITAAKVLNQSARPDKLYEKTWPASATLTVGFRDTISETFTSRLYCVPPATHRGRAGVGFVEAISGKEAPSPTFTADEEVGHYDLDAQKAEQEADTAEGPLAYLRTRWTVHGYPHKPAPANAEQTHHADLTHESATGAKEMTNVSLVVEFRFKNMMYEMMSKAATPRVADSMIGAFEKRCQELLAHQQAR